MTNLERRRGAIVLTHNRPELLQECIAAIQPQVDTVLVIDNASDPKAIVPEGVCLCYVPDQPPNLARLWNIGLDFYDKEWGDIPYDIAFLCDDAIVPPGWFAAVTSGMAATGAVAGCSNPWGYQSSPQLKTAPDSDLAGRMVGWAFILDATKGLRADESMHWWFCDTDMDWQARAHGGMCMVGDYPVPNIRPNDFTGTVPGLMAQSGADGETFAAKWGQRPW